jgi:lactoylglutathione lyase
MKFFIVLLTALSLNACRSGKPSGPVLNHIALYVQDLSRSTRFYQHTLGLDTIPEPFHDGRHTWFTIGGGQLHLISGAKTPILPEKNTHTCFSVPDMDIFLSRLKEASIPYENWAGQKYSVTKRIDGVLQVYFQDPDGYWIEVNNDRTGRGRRR